MEDQENKVAERVVERTVLKPGESDPERRQSSRRVILVIDYVYWVVMALFLIRFIFRLVGATKASNPIVAFIYGVTSPIYRLFVGIAPDWYVGSSKGPVVELSDLIAILLIWVLYHAILKLIDVVRSE